MDLLTQLKKQWTQQGIKFSGGLPDATVMDFETKHNLVFLLRSENTGWESMEWMKRRLTKT